MRQQVILHEDTLGICVLCFLKSNTCFVKRAIKFFFPAWQLLLTSINVMVKYTCACQIPVNAGREFTSLSECAGSFHCCNGREQESYGTRSEPKHFLD